MWSVREKSSGVARAVLSAVGKPPPAWSSYCSGPACHAGRATRTAGGYRLIRRDGRIFHMIGKLSEDCRQGCNA